MDADPREIPAADEASEIDSQETVVSETEAGLRVAGTESIPDRIGGFRIVSPLGAGGMGIVYAAVQDQPRRTVALKILRPDLLTEDLQRRFDNEAEVLGRLQHEGIARIYETGRLETAFGAQPYYAMELVEGTEIVEFAESHGLDVDERIELFTKLVDAVHAAHMKGVIHRDLKPANVLVTDESTVKILDFGLARLTDAAGDAMRTMAGQLVGTLNYMSPEQAQGRNDAIDVRTDVYSLGVILYQLLAGELPVETRGMPLAEAVELIGVREPRALGNHDQRLRGDLELVVAKALAKEVSRRYDSAASFAADLRAYLRHDLVSARPPSTFYRLSKFARRHRALVASVAVIGLFLAVATAVSLRYAVRADREAAAAEKARSRAAQEARRAEKESAARLREAERAEKAAAAKLVQVERTHRYSRFIVDTFAGIDPAVAAGREMTLREALVEVEKKFEAELDDDPVSRAELHNMFGQLWRTSGDFARAKKHAEAAVALAEDLEDSDALHAAALQTLAWIEYREGELDDAREDLDTSLDILVESGGEETLSYAWGVATLAEVASARREFGRAEKLGVEALERRERLLPGADHREIADSHIILANIYKAQGKVGESREHAEASLAMRRRIYGDVNPTVGECLSVLAHCALAAGDLERASELLEESYGIQKKTLDPSSRALAVAQVNLGYLAFQRGEDEEAGRWYADALASFSRLFGPESVEVADVHVKRALVHRRLGDRESMRADGEAAIAICREFPDRNPWIRLVAANLLGDLVESDEPLAAAEYYAEAAAAAAAEFGRNATDAVAALRLRARALASGGESGRAAEVLRDAVDRLRDQESPAVDYLGACLLDLGDLMTESGDHAAAEPLLLESLALADRLDEPRRSEHADAVRAALARLHEVAGASEKTDTHRDGR